MSGAKHTPGPWHTFAPDPDAGWLDIASPDGTVIVGNEGIRLDEATEANASLIAAAPDLLEALEKARQDINWMLNSRQFLNPDVFKYLDSAIAKATGNPSA